MFRSKCTDAYREAQVTRIEVHTRGIAQCCKGRDYAFRKICWSCISGFFTSFVELRAEGLETPL